MLLNVRVLKRSFLFLGGFFIGFVPFYASASMDAKHASSSDDNVVKPETTERQQAQPEIKKTDAELLSDLFSWPLKVVEQKFKATLPQALKSSMEGSHEQISQILAQLFATNSTKEWKQIVEKADKQKTSQEKKQKENQVNSDSNHLLQRISEMGKQLLGKKAQPMTADTIGFLAQAKKDWEAQAKKTQAAVAMRDQALDANTSEKSRADAKNWLRNPLNVHPDQVFAFISAQLKAGNDKDAVKWFRAMGWDNGKFAFADLTNGGNPVRFYAGDSDEEIAKNLKAYETSQPENARMNGLSFNGTLHKSPQEIYGASGQIALGRPKGLKAVSIQ